MKDLIKKAALSSLALSVILAPAMSYAGYHTTAQVQTGDTLMYGSMNVRYSSASINADSWIAIEGYVNGTITISAYESTNGYFYCTVSPSSSLYSQLVQIRSGFTNGAYIYAGKSSSSNECNSIQLINASYYLD